MANLYKIMALTTAFEMSIVSISLAVTLYIARKDIRFKFFTLLCILMILTDIGTALYAIGDCFEGRPIEKIK